MNATNVICNEIIEKITKLHEQISQSDLRLPDENIPKKHPTNMNK